MKIQKIKFGGFANIEELEMDLGKFNALIALNNYGKSNVLRAIYFGFDFIKNTAQIRNKMMAFRPVIPINTFTANLPFTFEVTFITKLENDDCEVNYGFSFDWIKNDKLKGQRIRDEFLKIKSLKQDSKPRAYIKRNLKEALHLTSPTGRCDKAIRISRNELVITKLNYFDNLFYWDIIHQINNLNLARVETLQDPDGLFTNIEISDEDPISQNDHSLTMEDAKNPAYFIFSLMKKDNKKYELLKDSIKSLLPNLEEFEPIEINIKDEADLKKPKEDLPFNFPEKVYDVKVKEKNNNQKTSIRYLSSGSQRLFYILTSTIAAEHNNIPILTFEELENSIHPGLLQKLLIILDSLTTKTKVIFSSHSPHLIQYLDSDNIKIGIPNLKSLSIFKGLKKSSYNKLVKIALEEGIPAGDMIFDKMIQATEEDCEFLNGLCK